MDIAFLRNYLRSFVFENIIFINQIHDHNTRNRYDLKLPLTRAEQMKKNLFHNGLKMYKSTKEFGGICEHEYF